MTPIPYAPWCWYIYLGNIPYLEHMGIVGMVLTINIGIIDSDYISGDLDY